MREKKEKSEQRKADRRKIEEKGGRIKSLFCVESETHFLVRG